MSNPLIRVENLKKYFEIRESLFDSIFKRQKKRYVKAVDGVSFEIYEGEIFGLIGESGSGKTTIGKLMVNLLEPTSGKIFFEGNDIFAANGIELKKIRTKIQMIFQDPFSSLSPWLTAYKAIAEPLEVNKLVKSETETKEKVEEMMTITGLEPIDTIMSKFPHELSGGQRQRVGISRALILNPKLIIADEPVSMIDVSLRLNILNLILDNKEKFDFSGLFITHDIAMAKYMCDRIGVLYLGKMLEIASTKILMKEPLHPYMKALQQAVPKLETKKTFKGLPIKGEISSSMDIPPGCRFNPRCLVAMDICKKIEPDLIQISKDHSVACHLYN